MGDYRKIRMNGMWVGLIIRTIYGQNMACGSKGRQGQGRSRATVGEFGA